MTDRPFPVPPFARRCIDEAADLWGASFEHPFVLALAEGTLDPDLFRFYQMQDARYLETIADAFNLIATRCPLPHDKLWFVEAARLALVVERDMHLNYGKRLGYTAEDIRRLKPTPNNLGYQNHMIASAVRGSLVEAVGAIAPCPWLYIDLGRSLLEKMGTIKDDHPYADWLRMYSDPGFNEYMENLLERLQRFADAVDVETRDRAVEAFIISARYEWMFWQQAWEQQPWPVG